MNFYNSSNKVHTLDRQVLASSHLQTQCNHSLFTHFIPDTIKVSSEVVFTANHLTDTDKQNSMWKIHKLNTTQKANNAKYINTKLPWFSRCLRHSARNDKRDGLILRSPITALTPSGITNDQLSAMR